MSVWKEGVECLHEIAFDNQSPETCLEIFEGSSNFIGLKCRIEKADEKWVEEFLELQGLEKLFEMLEELSSKTSRIGLSDEVQELKCAHCIKSIMNHELGMEHVIKTGEMFIYKLTKGKAVDLS